MGHRLSLREEFPYLADCLVDRKNDSVTCGSAKKVDWLCPNCGSLIEQKSIAKVTSRQSIPCPHCSDGVSRAEKITASALRQVGVHFAAQIIFAWSERKRYDFFLEDYQAIIEVHGIQHYEHGFEELNGITTDDQVEVDKYKYQLAMLNGIQHYFVIEAKNVTAKHIVPQIRDILSELKVCGIICEQKCEIEAMGSNVVKAANLWNQGFMSHYIAEQIGVTATTVIKYLKSASSAGLCDYSTYGAHLKSQRLAVAQHLRKVKCDTTGEIFESLVEAKKRYGISSASNILRACNNPSKHAGVFNGMPLSWSRI